MTRPRYEEEEPAGREHTTGSSAAPYPPTTYNEAPQYPPTPPPGPFVPRSPQPFVPGQPVAAASPYPANIGGPWSTGLFDCNLNQSNAIMTAFFPCVTFGQIAEILDEGGTSCLLGSFMYILMVPALLTCWIMGSNYRKKLRSKYDLVQAPSEDWTVHLFCSCCALCQEFRELQHRGIDPSLGWMGYLAQKNGTITVPPMNQFVSR